MTEDLNRKGIFFIHFFSGVSIVLGEITVGEACRIAGEKLKNDPKIQLAEKDRGEVENWKSIVESFAAKSMHIKRADDIK